MVRRCRLLDEHFLLFAIITAAVMTLQRIPQLLELNTIYLDGLEANIPNIELVLLCFLVGISNSLTRIHLAHGLHHDGHTTSRYQGRIAPESIRVERVGGVHDGLRRRHGTIENSRRMRCGVHVGDC